jgi:sulfur carrier protein ThiS
MKLTVELQSYLLQYSPDEIAVFEYEVPDGASVAELTRKLGVPEELASVIMVSGEAKSPEHVLVEGERVTLIPPIAGGA